MAGGKRDLASLLGTGGGKRKTASSGSGGSILERARAAAATAKRAKTDATNGDSGEGAAMPSAGDGRAADARNATGPASTSASPGGQKRGKRSRWDADAPRDDALAESRWANETDDASPEASDSAAPASPEARRARTRDTHESYMDKMMREAAEFKMRRVDDERADADADAPGVGPPASRPTASVNIAAIMAMRTPSSDGDATPRASKKENPSLDGFRDSDENANGSLGGLDDLALLEDGDDDKRRPERARALEQVEVGGDDDDAGDDAAFRRPSRSPSPERAAIPSDSDESSELGRGVDDEGPSSPPGALPRAPRAFDATAACRSVFDFEQLNKIDEGTYGVVFRARDKRSGKIYALKKVKMEKEREGFPQTALREANILLSMHHPNVVDVSEMVVGNSLDSVFMVMEFCEHDLKGFMSTMRAPFSVPEVKCLMTQLLSGVAYMHENWTLHRDLKTSNILVNNRGELKICDFGLARVYGEPLGAYTPTVVTLWYRAPELLLGTRRYGPAIDVWSLGCVMAELLASEPLFAGKTEIDQLSKMFATLGAPSDAVWPGCKELPGAKKVTFPNQPYNHLRRRFPGPPTNDDVRRTSVAIGPDGRERRADDARHTPAPLSDAGFDLLNRMLAYDPAKRITAEDASKHPFFAEFPPAKARRLMPTFPSRAGNVEARRKKNAD